MPHFGGEQQSNGGGGGPAVLESSNSMDLSVHSSNSSSTLEEKKHGADLLLSLAETVSEHAAIIQSSSSSQPAGGTSTKTNGVISRQVTPLLERNPVVMEVHSSNNPGEETGATADVAATTAAAAGSPLVRMSVHGSAAVATSPLRALTKENDKDEKKEEGDSHEGVLGGNKRASATDSREDQAVATISKKARVDDNDTSPTSALLSLAISPIRHSSSLFSNTAAVHDLKNTPATSAGNTISRVTSHESQLASTSTTTTAPTTAVVMAMAYHQNGGQQQQQMYAPAPYSAYMHHPSNFVATLWPPGHPPPPQVIAGSPYSYRPAHFMSAPQQQQQHHQHHVVHHTTGHHPGAPSAQYYHIMGPGGVPVPAAYTSTMQHCPPPQQHVVHYQQHRNSPAPQQQQQLAKCASSSSSPTNDGGATVPTIMSPPRPRRTSPSSTTSSIATTEETMSAKHAEAQAEACKSVSAWQRQQQQQKSHLGGGGGCTGATLRCIPLTHPMQSRCWRCVMACAVVLVFAYHLLISPPGSLSPRLLFCYIPEKLATKTWLISSCQTFLDSSTFQTTWPRGRPVVVVAAVVDPAMTRPAQRPRGNVIASCAASCAFPRRSRPVASTIFVVPHHLSNNWTMLIIPTTVVPPVEETHRQRQSTLSHVKTRASVQHVM
jgi:hypothetical protein